MRVLVKLLGFFFWLFSLNCQDGGVTATGNTEEGSYGDVIHFECVSIDKKIDGSSDIHCTETGELSDSVPKCKEITCTAPDISNGYVVEKMQEYQKDAILKYRCSPGFKPREGIPRCAKFGWTLNPECEEIRCEVPRDQHVSSPGYYFSGDEKLGVKRSYYCISGYDKMSSEATCTRDGWTPKPLCAGKCGPPPQVDSADTKEITKSEYNSGEKVEYICFKKHRLDERHPYSKYLTCEQGEWRGNIKCLKPCSVTVDEMDKRGIKLKWGEQQKIFVPHQDRIEFACRRGKKLIGSDDLLKQTCNDGEMNLPECV